MRSPDSSGADAVAHETPVPLPQKVVEYEQFMDRLKASGSLFAHLIANHVDVFVYA